MNFFKMFSNVFFLLIIVMSNYSIGVCILGDCNVGKTTFSINLTTGVFSKKSVSTIGLEFAAKNFDIIKDEKRYKIKWNIWDTAGQEFYRSLISGYYRNGTVLILMFDLSNLETFESVDFWLKELKKYGNGIQIYILSRK